MRVMNLYSGPLCRASMLTALAGALTAGGCRTPQPDPAPIATGPVSTNHPAAPSPSKPQAAPTVAQPEDLASGDSLAPERRALLIGSGPERWVDAHAAAVDGYTIVDLSDGWTPFIFAEHTNADGQRLHSRYSRVFVGLANDQLDEDGQPLPPGSKNYLELYGIPPSLSVLRARFLEDAGKACHDDSSRAALEAVDTVAHIPPERVRAEDLKLARLHQELERARHKAKAPTIEALAAQEPAIAAKLKILQKRMADQAAITAVETRLACEGFLATKGEHKQGTYDEALRQAIKSFQQKHMIYESHYLRKETVESLSRSLLENDVLALKRSLRERVVDAAGVIEDGSADTSRGAPQFTTSKNEKLAVTNLADSLTEVVATALQVNTEEGALAFFNRYGPSDFQHLRVAVKLAPRPDYHRPHMELSIVIDRGDVWYDLPFDDAGKPVPQPRQRFPTFTLFVTHQNQRVPLIRWRTTIGGWRAEQASDGYEYYRYKGSDVGPRVIRNVVAGPVWIPPESTPIRALVKTKRVFGRSQPAVNYSELGPGFMSAYGLVAGYFVVPGKAGRPDWDNGIRAHGSSEYLSMYSPSGFSHGCHRLPNHLAIRLYSFMLRHRNMRVVGDQTMDLARQFLKGDEVFEIRLPSRGFAYQLDPPLPVDVLEGEIKGKENEPLTGYVPKPGVTYPGPPPLLPDSPEARAGGGAASPGAFNKLKGGASAEEEAALP